MNRRQALATLASTLPAVAFGASNEPSTKKGWAGGDAKLHKLFGANWYYTWSPKTRPSKAIEFVPMIKGEWSLKQTDAIKSMGDISHLLGFNEPERTKQGNITLERNKDVERYAYFNPGKGKPHSLIKNDDSLTRMGELYRDAG